MDKKKHCRGYWQSPAVRRCLLGGIDPYGDTVFNRVQAPRVLAEWREVEEKAKTLDERELCRSIREFFEEAERGVHQYVRFIGAEAELGITEEQMAGASAKSRSPLSRPERREERLLSTPRRTVRSLGELELTAVVGAPSG